jgi:hypothetical protein
MLGWEIYINRKPFDTSGCIHENRLKDNSLLANWQTGIDGCSWVEKLVEQGKAKFLGSYGGYPRSYSAKAEYVIPLVMSLKSKTEGPTVVGEDYAYIGGFNSDIELFLDRIAACPLNEELSIEAWDQS